MMRGSLDTVKEVTRPYGDRAVTVAKIGGREDGADGHLAHPMPSGIHEATGGASREPRPSSTLKCCG